MKEKTVPLKLKMTINKIKHIKCLLRQSSSVPKARDATFFKTGVGHYAEHDHFIGVNVPILRKIANDFSDLTLTEIQVLLESPINEYRSLGLFILVNQYKKSQIVSNTHPKFQDELQNELYQFYLNNLKYVNNWNLVDASAHLIIGAHLFKTGKGRSTLLLALAKSDILWERRIAIVSTLYFIRNDDLKWTFKLAKILLKDRHDLIHKAVGWMLREAGKRDKNQLIAFLDQHANQMPRTMLRYAIEKFTEPQRKSYLIRGISLSYDT